MCLQMRIFDLLCDPSAAICWQYFEEQQLLLGVHRWEQHRLCDAHHKDSTPSPLGVSISPAVLQRKLNLSAGRKSCLLVAYGHSADANNTTSTDWNNPVELRYGMQRATKYLSFS